MPNISIKIRKELWGKAAGRCSMCKRKLTLDDDRHTNISNECHIISEKKNGPRHIEGIKDYNSYDNLILLCRNHHAEIDNNVNKYTVERLKEIKRQHEKYVNERLKSNIISLIVMTIINNGIEFGALLWGCHSFQIYTDNSDVFLITIKDELNDCLLNFLNLQDEFSLSDKIVAYEELNILLNKAHLSDLTVYASVSQLLMSSFPTKCINILLSQKHSNDIIVFENTKSYDK